MYTTKTLGAFVWGKPPECNTTYGSPEEPSKGGRVRTTQEIIALKSRYLSCWSSIDLLHHPFLKPEVPVVSTMSSHNINTHIIPQISHQYTHQTMKCTMAPAWNCRTIRLHPPSAERHYPSIFNTTGESNLNQPQNLLDLTALQRAKSFRSAGSHRG